MLTVGDQLISLRNKARDLYLLDESNPVTDKGDNFRLILCTSAFSPGFLLVVKITVAFQLVSLDSLAHFQYLVVSFIVCHLEQSCGLEYSCLVLASSEGSH